MLDPPWQRRAHRTRRSKREGRGTDRSPSQDRLGTAGAGTAPASHGQTPPRGEWAPQAPGGPPARQQGRATRGRHPPPPDDGGPRGEPRRHSASAARRRRATHATRKPARPAGQRAGPGTPRPARGQPSQTPTRQTNRRRGTGEQKPGARGKGLPIPARSEADAPHNERDTSKPQGAAGSKAERKEGEWGVGPLFSRPTSRPPRRRGWDPPSKEPERGVGPHADPTAPTQRQRHRVTPRGEERPLPDDKTAPLGPNSEPTAPAPPGKPHPPKGVPGSPATPATGQGMERGGAAYSHTPGGKSTRPHPATDLPRAQLDRR